MQSRLVLARSMLLSLRPLRTARAQKLVSTLDARTPNHKS
jgi:hypothetical protein